MSTPPTATSRPCVVVTTYARPDGLARLLDDLEREAPAGGLDVRVYDDGTPNPDAAIERRVRANGWTSRRAPLNHGKHDWWRWWNVILADLRAARAERFVVLQDDMRLCKRFFARSEELWASIGDPQKASLYLHLSAERAEPGSRCWTPVRADRSGRVVHCGWVDCAAFIAHRRLFEVLGWQLEPIPGRRWSSGEHLSSGVGQQISVRAHRHGLGMYRVERSLTIHGGSPSLMNAEARRHWSMSTLAFVDGEPAARALMHERPAVFASLATIPAREAQLRHVVAALLPQVDELGVYLNGYDRVPSFLRDDQIRIARSQDHGDRGDAGKFAWAGTSSGYHLACDDDLAYPPDYVERLVAGIERHARRAVVGFHGCVLHAQSADYHRGRRLLHFWRALRADTPVHVLGTGLAGYHASTIRVRPEDFREANMADVWLGLLGQHQRVPFVCLHHEAGWLRELPGVTESLYARARRRPAGARPSPETQAVRSRERWELHTLPGAPAERPKRRPTATPPRRPPAPPLAHVGVTGPRHCATLVLPERDHITAAVRRFGTYYERDLLDAIREHAVRGAFVDIGAHYGNHTTFFGLECEAERVIAIEPNPPAFAGLLETVAENALQAVVAAYQLAVHPSWRRVAVTALGWRARPGAATNSGRARVAQACKGGDAPAAPLDEILADVSAVGLVKVDADGSSAEILASGSRMLRRDRPLIAAQAATDAQRHALRALLSPQGYRELGPYCWTATWLWEPVGANETSARRRVTRG